MFYFCFEEELGIKIVFNNVTQVSQQNGGQSTSWIFRKKQKSINMEDEGLVSSRKSQSFGSRNDWH